MTASYTYDGDDLTRVRRESLDIHINAELGSVGQSSMTYDDTPGTQEIIGDKDFEANEDDCATPLLLGGTIADRAYYRGLESTGMGREIDISVEDHNARLRWRGLTDTDANRTHEETVDDRMAWLMSTAAVSGLFIDNGRIASSSNMMDKSNYRFQTPADVIADCALAARGFNFHVQDYGSGPELIFRNDNTSTADSMSLRISNVLTDTPWQIGDTVSGTQVFAPSKDARLTRSPSMVWSKMAESFAKGTRVQSRAATATAFNGERFGQVSNSNIKTVAMADADLAHQLLEHSTEEDVIECSILVPSSAVNLFPPGYRMQAKFSHLTTEGYGSFTWFRILEVGKKSLLKPAALYELSLKLSPQETAPTPASCSDAYANTPDGTFYPSGGFECFPGQLCFHTSDGPVYYLRPGIFYPVVPTAGAEQSWHYPELGVGGAGTIDYAGDCVQNIIRLITVGNGEWTIQTEIFGATRPMAYRVKKTDETLVAGPVEFTSGDEIVVTIDDATDGDCIRLVDISDGSGSPCGGKWGWSVATWDAA